MNCYKATGISRQDIRRVVRHIKKLTGLENIFYFPIMQFLELVLPTLIPDFVLEVVPVKEMGNKHGETYPSKNLIRIREDVYLGAHAGNGRDRLTIAHEIGHLLLHDDDSIALCRLAPDEKLKAYEDPEWQANAFGGELLASSYLINGLSVREVSERCGVTEAAASVQLNALKK